MLPLKTYTVLIEPYTYNTLYMGLLYILVEFSSKDIRIVELTKKHYSPRIYY